MTSSSIPIDRLGTDAQCGHGSWQLTKAADRPDVLDGGLLPGPLRVLPHQQDRLPLGGHQQLPLPDGPAQIEEIGVLNDQRQLAIPAWLRSRPATA